MNSMFFVRCHFHMVWKLIFIFSWKKTIFFGIICKYLKTTNKFEKNPSTERERAPSSRAKRGFSLKNKCKTECCTCWPSSTIEQLPTRARCSSHKVGTSVQAHQRQTCHWDCRQFIYSFIDGYSYSANVICKMPMQYILSRFWKKKKKERFFIVSIPQRFVTSEFCFCMRWFFFSFCSHSMYFYFDIEKKKVMFECTHSH